MPIKKHDLILESKMKIKKIKKNEKEKKEMQWQ